MVLMDCHPTLYPSLSDSSLLTHRLTLPPSTLTVRKLWVMVKQQSGGRIPYPSARKHGVQPTLSGWNRAQVVVWQEGREHHRRLYLGQRA